MHLICTIPATRDLPLGASVYATLTPRLTRGGASGSLSTDRQTSHPVLLSDSYYPYLTPYSFLFPSTFGTQTQTMSMTNVNYTNST